jgi:hypothetical protein
MRWHLVLLTLLWCALPGAAQDAQPGKDKVKPLAGWPGTFPVMPPWARTFQQPSLSADGKVHSQGVQYEWTGGASKRLVVSLSRSPAVKDQFDPKKLQKDGPPFTELKIGQYPALLWDLRGLKDKAVMPLQKRLVILLGEDRVLQLDARGVGPWESLEKLAGRFDLEKMAKALDAPPRTDFGRKVEAFRELKKGMSYAAVREWVGDADRDVGSGIHVMVYDLDDGSRVLLGFPGFEKLIYVKHEVKPGQAVDLVK